MSDFDMTDAEREEQERRAEEMQLEDQAKAEREAKEQDDRSEAFAAEQRDRQEAFQRERDRQEDQRQHEDATRAPAMQDEPEEEMDALDLDATDFQDDRLVHAQSREAERGREKEQTSQGSKDSPTVADNRYYNIRGEEVTMDQMENIMRSRVEVQASLREQRQGAQEKAGSAEERQAETNAAEESEEPSQASASEKEASAPSGYQKRFGDWGVAETRRIEQENQTQTQRQNRK